MALTRHGRPQVINLCFHGIGTPRRTLEPGEDKYWVSVDAYHRILDAVMGDERVRINFDDGNLSDVEIGLPGLLDRNLTARFFVLAGRLDQGGSLSPEDVRRLTDAGMTVGSHGMDHVPWRGLAPHALHRELVDARSRLEEVTGTPVDEAALPLGRYDRRVLGRAAPRRLPDRLHQRPPVGPGRRLAAADASASAAPTRPTRFARRC